MLSFEEFQDYCKEHLVGALPDGYENATVTVNEVIKNNGRVLTALTVMPEGQNVAPNIYLDGFYMEYETGTDLDTIMDEMADLCMSHIHPSQDISNIGQQFRDVNFVRDRIIMVAVNREKNAELLSDCPHTNREDACLVGILFHRMIQPKARQQQKHLHAAAAQILQNAQDSQRAAVGYIGSHMKKQDHQRGEAIDKAAVAADLLRVQGFGEQFHQRIIPLTRIKIIIN